MIHVHTERLLPIKELPAYLESRGFGRRVARQTVNRWIRHGSDGAHLEVIRIGGRLMTSVEAVQRWIVAQNSGALQPTRATAPSAPHPPCRSPAPPTLSEQEAERILMEHRLVPTQLDRLIEGLPDVKSGRSHVAGALFRNGYRTPRDVADISLDALLAIPRIGKASSDLLRAIKAAADGQQAQQ